MRFFSRFLYIWSFPGDEEEAYNRFVFPANLIALRLVSFINVFGMTLFLLVDCLSEMKFNHIIVLVARSISLLVSSAVLVISFRKPVSVLFTRAGIVLITLVALGTAITTATFAGLPPYYLTNLLFVLFVLIMTASGFHFRHSILLGSACFLIFILYSQLVNRDPFFASQYLHLITTFLYVGIVSVVLESRRRRSFVQFSDLQNQKKLVEDMSRQKDRIISILSHDVASPLNSLSGLLALHVNGQITDEELQPFLKEMGVRLNNVSSLLRSVLHWSRTQMKGFVPEKKTINLKEHFNEQFDLFRPAALDKGIEITISVSGTLKIFADEEMVRIAVRNLISNAIKFAAINSNVMIEGIPRDDQTVAIKVTNKGTPIPDDLRPKLFSIEVPSSIGTGGEKGTGIGLAMSAFFVKLNGGDMSVEPYNGREDCETCFTISLPAAT